MSRAVSSPASAVVSRPVVSVGHTPRFPATALVVTRGLPGSGKTTWAWRVVDGEPLGSVVRVNRDELRVMALPAGYREPVDVAEGRVTLIQRAAVRAFLAGGCSVICDDTNLSEERVGAFRGIARGTGVGCGVVDFTFVLLEECIERDAGRDLRERVGEGVIRVLHARFLGGAR